MHFTFGYSEVFSDILWMRLLQDTDFCENKDSANICSQVKWLGAMLNVVTDTSPKFRLAYYSGGLFLNMLVKDHEGASIIYDKAVKQFPKDWPLLYHAAYHAMANEKNKEKAAGLMKRAGENGAPQWVFALAAKLYDENGTREIGIRMLEQMIEENPKGPFVERLKKRLAELKSKTNS